MRKLFLLPIIWKLNIFFFNTSASRLCKCRTLHQMLTASGGFTGSTLVPVWNQFQFKHEELVINRQRLERTWTGLVEILKAAPLSL